MPQTMFNGWTYPEFKEQPYWEKIRGFYNQIDLGIYQLKSVSNALLMGGGTIGWAGGTNLMTFTDDFVIPILQSGYVVQVATGPDQTTKTVTLNAGEFAYVSLPSVIKSNYETYIKTTSVWNKADGVFLIAYNLSNVLYLRNGQVLS